MHMARRRKPGRPKGSKNKKRSKTGRKRKATPAQLRNLKKARAVRAKNLKKTRGKKTEREKIAAMMKADGYKYPRESYKAVGKRVNSPKKKAAKKRGRKSAVYHKRVENLKKARAARELKQMPKTRRMALKQLHADMMADTVRGPHIVVIPERHMSAGAPSILRQVRRHMPTLLSQH
jgi:hypothetical protein